MQKQEKISKRFTSSNDNVELATHMAKEFCISLGQNSHFVNDIELGLTEAINNIIEHSYLDKQDECFRLEIIDHDNCIEFILSDTGQQRPDNLKVSLDFNPDDIENLPEGGMGLFIIEQVMDKTQYERIDGKNHLKLIKNKTN